MIGDRLFNVDGELAARFQARASQAPVYFYLFSYRGKHSLSEVMSGSTDNFARRFVDIDLPPTCHAEDDKPITHYEDDEDEVFFGFDNTVEAHVPSPDGLGEDGDISSNPDDTAPNTDLFSVAIFVIAHAQRVSLSDSRQSSHGRYSLGTHIRVRHADDTAYISDVFYSNTKETEQDRAMSKLLLDLFTSFAKTGVPRVPGDKDVTWEPVMGNAQNITYLHIPDSTNLEMRSNEDLSNKDFWLSLPINEPHKSFTEARAPVELNTTSALANYATEADINYKLETSSSTTSRRHHHQLQAGDIIINYKPETSSLTTSWRHHQLQAGDIIINYKPTETLEADVLTKALASPKRSQLVCALGLGQRF
uniref:Carboxylesterase type B domain-containing protein n=1 Tax=Timema shepardi TaxID=629360 RepID=A0A7R9FXL5_TIMSH|nr:unnamed protein product [Timema shepardi]